MTCDAIDDTTGKSMHFGDLLAVGDCVELYRDFDHQERGWLGPRIVYMDDVGVFRLRELTEDETYARRAKFANALSGSGEPT